MAEMNDKCVWEKGDLEITKIVYKEKVIKSLEELRSIKEEEEKAELQKSKDRFERN